MTAQRNMNIMDLSSIIQTLSAQKRTGTLRIEGPDDEKLLYFNKGNIELVLARHRKFKLGEALIKYGRLTEERLEEALAHQRQNGGELGKILVEKEILTEKEIRDAVVFQITEEVCDVFTWQSADCEFLEDRALPEIEKLLGHGIQVMVNPESLIMEAARRVDEWEIIKKIVPSTKDVFQATPASLRYANEEGWEPEREVLSLVDGVKDVADIIQKAKMPKFEALKTVYKLASNGDIESVSGARLVELGLQHSGQGDIRKAIRLFERAEELGVEGLDIDHRLARAYEAMGAAEKAIAKYLAYARRKEQDGEMDQAVYAYERIIQLDPEEMKWHERLIGVLIKQNRREEVIRHARRLETKYLARNQKERAVAVWHQVQEAFPDAADSYEALAKLHLKYDETVQAIIELENLAGLHLLRGEKEAAVKVFKKILQLDEECVQARMSLAATLAETGRAQEALDEYHKLAETLTRSGIMEESANLVFLVDVYGRVATLDPENLQVRLKLAEAEESRGNTERALAAWREAADLMRRKNQRDEQFVHVLERIVHHTPDDAEAQEELARAYIEVGMSQKAINQYERLALAALGRNAHEDALRYLEEARKAEPLRIDTFHLMAEVHRRTGDREREGELLRRIAWLFICMDDYRSGEEALERASEVMSADLGTLLLLAEIYERQKRLERLESLLLRLTETALKRHDLGLASWMLDRLRKAGSKHEKLGELRNELEKMKKRSEAPEQAPIAGGREMLLDRIRIIPPKKKGKSPASEAD